MKDRSVTRGQDVYEELLDATHTPYEVMSLVLPLSPMGRMRGYYRFCELVAVMREAEGDAMLRQGQSVIGFMLPHARRTVKEIRAKVRWACRATST